jgi:uncharacterized phage protein (TIGR02218 family)
VKTSPAALLTHYTESVTTLATLWLVTRTDGEVFGFTDHDKPISFGGVTFQAASGFTASQIASSASLAVDNVEVDGFFDSEAIQQSDLEAGVWDGATIKISQVNYADLTDGEDVLRVGELGNFTSRDGLYVAELRGLMDKLQKTVTRLYLSACNADLGDARCGFDIESRRVYASVTSTTDRRQFWTDLSTGSPSSTTGEFTYGVLTWLSGENAGRSMEVKEHAAAGEIILQLPMVGAVEIGDDFSIVPGCAKSLEVCRDRYDNVINFRGFPHIPGLDRMVRPGGN